ncbi:MAG: hypothetical protein CM15mP102_14510 [Flavobacteriales bacterium]|nr:MAG: hypothetical protein CM15mP102_14510 [Flavobacteriales bacterium]
MLKNWFKNYNESNGALNSNYAKIKANETELKVPVIIQPGQAKGTVGLAFGYGREIGIKDEMKTGVNAFKLYKDFSKSQKVTLSQYMKFMSLHAYSCIILLWVEAI